MNKLVTTAAVLVALIAPASARESSKTPAALLGTWCLVSENEYGSTYKRGQCPDDERRLTIFPLHYEAADDWGCKWTRGS